MGQGRDARDASQLDAAVNDRFWRAPPWQGGVRKHRLGLKPIERAQWLATPPTERELANKQKQLNARYAQVVGKTACCADIDALLAQLPLPGEPADRYPDLIANVALTVADDLCVLDAADQQRLVMACVCAPSYWRLLDKLGHGLSEVHAPVPGLNAKIGVNIQRFVERAPLDQPFARSNWFLHADDQLFHDREEGALALPPARWIVRSEEQTLCRLSSNYLLFTIRIVTEPLAHIAGFTSAQTDLLQSLDNMDADEIEHLGGVEKHRRLAEYVALCRNQA